METAPSEKLVICIQGEDQYWDYSDHGLDFDSPESTVLETLKPAIEEHFGVSLTDDYGSWLYKTHKAVNTRNIFIIPNSTAGR